MRLISYSAWNSCQTWWPLCNPWRQSHQLLSRLIWTACGWNMVSKAFCGADYLVCVTESNKFKICLTDLIPTTVALLHQGLHPHRPITCTFVMFLIGTMIETPFEDSSQINVSIIMSSVFKTYAACSRKHSAMTLLLLAVNFFKKPPCLQRVATQHVADTYNTWCTAK